MLVLMVTVLNKNCNIQHCLFIVDYTRAGWKVNFISVQNPHPDRCICATGVEV